LTIPTDIAAMIHVVVIIAAAVIIGVSVIVAVVIHYRIYRKYHYKCTKCSGLFKPTTFAQSIFALNAGEERKLKCPQCDKREWASAIEGEVPK